VGRKHKTIPRGDETTQKLKDKIRRLESDKRKLLAELRTLQDAFNKSREYIEKKVVDIPVEELIKMADKPLRSVQEALSCKKCSSNSYTFISTPKGDRIKICKDCKFRETQDDSSNVDNTTEAIQ